MDVMPYAHELTVNLRGNEAQSQKISVYCLAQTVSQWSTGIYCHHCLTQTVYHLSYCALGVQKGHGNVLILCQQRCPVGHCFRQFWQSGGTLVMRVVSIFLIILSYQCFVLY